MTIAPLPSNEADRLAALRALAILDTPAEPTFDDLTRLAATLCGTPIGLVSLVDGERQWFKSRHGLDATETPRDVAFCTHAILGGDFFEIPDATADERFADNPLVLGPPDIRFYAGVPLNLPCGQNVGTLCVIDTTPRTLTDTQRDTLRVLARQVVAQLQLRQQLTELSGTIKRQETFRVLFEQSSDAHLIFDERDGILDCNHAAVEMLRCRDKSEVLALHPAVLSPEFQPGGRRSMEKCVEMDALARRDGYHRFDWTHRRADGEDFPCEVTLTPVELRGRTLLLVVWHDLTDRKRAEDALRASEALLGSAFEDAAIGMSLVAPDGRWLRVNRSLTAFLGYSPAELLATDFQTLTHPDDLDADLALVRQVLAGEVRAYHMEKRYSHKDGRTLHALLSVSLVRDAAAVPLYFVSQIQDIGPRKAAEEAVRASELKFRLVVDRLAEGMFVVDPASNRFVEVNAALLEMLGYRADEFLALSIADLVAGEPPETVARNVAVVHDALEKHGRHDLGRKHLRRKDGGVVPVEVRISLVPAGGAGLHAVIVRDVTEQVAAEDRLFEYQLSLEEANAKLRALAATDGLTGIRNRAAFNDRLTEEYERAARFGRPLSLLLMDVDHFKMFNDTFGHPAGDDVLKTVARTLVTTARITDFVARYGGEEFVLILPDTDIAGAMVVAERCRRAIAAVSWRERAVTISVGVSTRTGDTAEATDLVKQADEALYRSKAAGRNRVLHGSRAVPTTAAVRSVALSEPNA